MCTLIIGYHILGPGTAVIAANRDEDPARPSDPPARLSEQPRVVGGRDCIAGGTWLAVRERRAAIAMLNRRPAARETGPETGTHSAPLRSRGLLTLDLARTRDGGTKESNLGALVRERALGLLDEARYAPFSLAFISPDQCWVLTHESGTKPRSESLMPGWHVLTHANLDDQSEPRTARLLDTLSDFRPVSPTAAELGLIDRLKLHAVPATAGTEPLPTVCIHDGRMVTVSFSTVFLSRNAARYHHGEGRPCEHAPVDYSNLLAGDTAAVESA